ncbi:MAG: hypothetical protein COZ86_03030, partial [Candidatus Moranbacteria bacterium CG_4_8_14_3_um_filter_41_13]
MKLNGKEQLEAAIMNFPGYVNDNIDLTAFMEDEQKHRVRNAWEYRDRLRDLILGSGEVGQSMPWDAFGGKMEFRKSEMTLWAGFKGHGKSVIISQVLEHLMDKCEQKVFIISPEFPAHRVLYRLMVQSIGQRYPDANLLDMWLEAVKDQLWIYDQ